LGKDHQVFDATKLRRGVGRGGGVNKKTPVKAKRYLINLIFNFVSLYYARK